MEYVTIFDATRAPLQGLSAAAPGLAFTAIGAVLVLFPKFAEAVPYHGPQVLRRPLDWAFLIIGLLFTLAVLTSVISGQVSDAAALRKGDCRVVEGRVEHLQTTRLRGGYQESLVVAGVPFTYSDHQIGGGFRTTTHQGGPMAEGLQVRLCERAGHILRLEIAGP